MCSPLWGESYTLVALPFRQILRRLAEDGHRLFERNSRQGDFPFGVHFDVSRLTLLVARPHVLVRRGCHISSRKTVLRIRLPIHTTMY